MKMPYLMMYHANGKGTGTGIRIRMIPARVKEIAKDRYANVAGGWKLDIAPQKSITQPAFDWDKAMQVRLGFDELCHFQQVLRGECETINEKRGLFFREENASTVLMFEHIVDPVSGYIMTVKRLEVGKPDTEATVAKFLMTNAEALGVSMCIETSLSLVAFGVPYWGNTVHFGEYSEEAKA